MPNNNTTEKLVILARSRELMRDIEIVVNKSHDAFLKPGHIKNITDLAKDANECFSGVHGLDKVPSFQGHARMSEGLMVVGRIASTVEIICLIETSEQQVQQVKRSIGFTS